MKEAVLRKGHRYLGVILAVFIIAQAGGGLVLSVASLIKPHDHSLHDVEEVDHHNDMDHHASDHEHGSDHEHAAQSDHYGPMQESPSGALPAWIDTVRLGHGGGGTFRAIFRIIVGLGTISMAMSGLFIFFKGRNRQAG